MKVAPAQVRMDVAGTFFLEAIKELKMMKMRVMPIKILLDIRFGIKL